jgi:hypothetical protein
LEFSLREKANIHRTLLRAGHRQSRTIRQRKSHHHPIETETDATFATVNRVVKKILD